MSVARYDVPNNSGGAVNTERFTYEEVVFLLDLCEKYDIVIQSQSKGYSLVRAFSPIHKEMLANGYNRSLTQVIDKFRKLKLRYVHAYLERKKGKTAMASRFEHYKRFEKILDKAKIDKDLFIKKFSKKENSNSDDNSINYENTKDESNSRNILEYDNIDEYDTIAVDEDVLMEKEVLLEEEEYQNDDTIDEYSTENIDIKIIPNIEASSSSSFTNRKNDTKNMSPTDRTVYLLEQLIPSFKQAQQELQTQFFRQQRELQRQQQEWEERILDEEREYFTKILNSLNNVSNEE